MYLERLEGLIDHRVERGKQPLLARAGERERQPSQDARLRTAARSKRALERFAGQVIRMVRDPASTAAPYVRLRKQLAHCERHLGRYKTPKELRFVAELPRGTPAEIEFAPFTVTS